MTPTDEFHSLLKKLAVPAQDLAQLSFCRGSKETHVKEWLQTLSLTQSQQVSAQLYTALHEISRLDTSSEARLVILELLRIPVHHTLNGLALKYLNQPLILPEAALKTATIAQAIQKHFLNGYLAIVRKICTTPEPKKETQDLQALVIQRALTALGLLLLRSYQLYLPIASQLWNEIHALYQLACALGVAQTQVEDRLPHQLGVKTIHNNYLRLLLLASARPNQLRQDEIENTYNLLDSMAHYAELVEYDPKGKENLFVVLTDSNRPPFYKSHWRPASNPDSPAPLEMRTSQLVAKLQELQKDASSNTETTAHQPQLNTSFALIKHLEQTWNHLSLRSFERQDVNAEIEVTVGLTNIHFHLANEQPFNLFLNQASGIAVAEKAAIFQKRGVQLKKDEPKKDADPWGDAFDIKGTSLDGRELSTINIEKQLKTIEKVNYHGQHPIYTVPLVDRSLGGYGLEWRTEIPVQVRAGELLGLREYGRTKWTIGVVRWAHQIKGATQLGIKILAPQAIPVGIAIVHKTGGFSEYLRALQIPELRAANQPPSLITNAISFHEYNKARLYYQAKPGVSVGSDQSIQLTQRLFATGAFSQFGYRELMTVKAESTSAKDDFDSVWE